MLAGNIFRIIHSEFGEEQFEITWAKYNIYQSDDRIWEFTITCWAEKALRRIPTLEAIAPHTPDFEVTALLSASNRDLYPGKVITQEFGYDYDRCEHLSDIYYFEHTSIEALRIEILEVEATAITALVHGKARIYGRNGQEADAELFVSKTRFELDISLRRGVS